MNRLAVFFLGFLAASQGWGADNRTYFKCVKDGVTTISDAPCATDKSAQKVLKVDDPRLSFQRELDAKFEKWSASPAPRVGMTEADLINKSNCIASTPDHTLTTSADKTNWYKCFTGRVMVIDGIVKSISSN